MIKTFFALLLALASSTVFANAPDYPARLKELYFNNSNSTYIYYTDPVEACNKATQYPITSTSSLSRVEFTLTGPANLSASYVCTFYYKSGTSTVVTKSVRFHCPYGGTLNGGNCINVPDGQGEPKQCDDKNPFIRRWDYGTASVQPAPKSYGGCVITPIELLVCRKEPTGTTYCMWMVKRTGEVFTGTEAPGTSGNDKPDTPSLPPVKSPPVSAPPATGGGSGSCPTGTVMAGTSADGVPICMGTGSAPKNEQPAPPKVESEKNETLPDGSTQNTKTVTTTNSDGSTTTNTTVTITKPDGTKSTSGTSSTSNNSAGTAGTADRDPADDKYDLCKTNPNLSICRESSVSGTCGQIACVGDAIQCATLRAAALMQCKQQADEDALKASPLAAKGQAAIDGTDTSTLPTPGKAAVVDLGGLGNAEQGWLGAGSAFNDVTFTVQGHSITVPLSKATGFLVGLRYALMVAALLVSFRILSGAILRD